MDAKKIGNCVLCEKEKRLTFHHLIPRKCHSNKWFKKHFEKEEMVSRGINICRSCHNYIHSVFSSKELGRYFNTIETLIAHEKIAKFIAYAKKKK